MEARLGDTVVAQADEDEVIGIEGNAYVPKSALTGGAELQPSSTPYTCPWKGEASYWNLVVDGRTVEDAAWSYEEPYDGAADRVGQDFAGYVAFDTAKVQVS